MEITHSRGIDINSRRFYEFFSFIGFGKRLLYFTVVNLVIMYPGTAVKKVRFAFDYRSGQTRIINNLFRHVYELLQRNFMVIRRRIQVYELKTGFYSVNCRVYVRAVIQIDIDFNSKLPLVVVHHVPHIVQTDRLSFFMADFHQNR